MLESNVAARLVIENSFLNLRCQPSVLLNWELFLSKLSLVLEDEQIGHAQLFHFGRTDVLHLRTASSDKWKGPLVPVIFGIWTELPRCRWQVWSFDEVHILLPNSWNWANEPWGQTMLWGTRSTNVLSPFRELTTWRIVLVTAAQPHGKAYPVTLQSLVN